MSFIDLPGTVQEEFNQLMLGEKLGEGAYREVYEFAPDKSLVVKFELAATLEFCNVNEWNIWQEVAGTKLEQWFAPCEWISFSGSVLLQKRTEPLKRLPNKIPNVLADTKRDNWGRYKGKPVMHDYGNHAFFYRGIKGSRLVNRL
ncbi:MAG: hypothetical protein JJ979_11960 [Roseibium sp.]|nr:hypothetical protein [Roseibium sp.]